MADNKKSPPLRKTLKRGVGRDRTGDTRIFSPYFIGFVWIDM